MAFATTVGIEYTFNGSSPYVSYNRMVVGLDKIAKANKDKEFSKIYDDLCLEIPSPVHKSYKDMRRFYTKMMRYLKGFPIATHTEGEMNGGGHIHVGVPKHWQEDRKKAFIYNFLSDIANRPYLNWIFNEWCDDLNANHLSHDPNFRWLVCRAADSLLCVSFFNKDIAARWHAGYQTIELRFFDAKRDWSEVKDHVDFALRYYQYVLKKTEKAEVINVKVKTKKQVASFHFKRSVKEFNALLKELKLDPKRYRKYININYKTRIKHGRLV